MNRRDGSSRSALARVAGRGARRRAIRSDRSRATSLASTFAERQERAARALAVRQRVAQPRRQRARGSAGERFRATSSRRPIPMWNEAQRGMWRLEVGGAVRNPLSLTLDDLVKMRSVDAARGSFLRRRLDGTGRVDGRSRERARARGGRDVRRAVRGLPVVRLGLPRVVGHRQRAAPADAGRLRHGSALCSVPATARRHACTRRSSSGTRTRST